MGVNIGFKINIAKAFKKKHKTNTKVCVSRLTKAIVIKENNEFKAKIEVVTEHSNSEILIIPFTKESYSLKDKEIVFSHHKDETEHYVCFIRDKQIAHHFPGSGKIRTPFTEHIVITGHIIREDGKLYFDYKDFIAFNNQVVPTNICHIDDSKPLFLK